MGCSHASPQRTVHTWDISLLWYRTDWSSCPSRNIHPGAHQVYEGTQFCPDHAAVVGGSSDPNRPVRPALGTARLT